MEIGMRGSGTMTNNKLEFAVVLGIENALENGFDMFSRTPMQLAVDACNCDSGLEGADVDEVAEIIAGWQDLNGHRSTAYVDRLDPLFE